MIDNKLPESHIKEGNFVWYSGATHIGSWSCPAKIIDVDDGKRTFMVQSLDDMREQKQIYSFDLTADAPDSRLYMQPVHPETVKDYLKTMMERYQTRIEASQKHIEENKLVIKEMESLLDSIEESV
jgi:hypothetical protein